MTPRPRHHLYHRAERGIALLLALIALVVTAGISVALARLAVIDQLSRTLDDDQRLADDLLHAGEVPIQQWLQRESAGVVLPIDADTPAVVVLHDRWRDEDRLIEIRITAFDQLGMAPPEALTTGSLLRLAIPEAVLRQVDDVLVEKDALTGLDELIELRSRGEDLDMSAWVVYPDMAEAEAQWFGDRVFAATTPPLADGEIQPAIGGYLATHNPPPGMINVNTAPLHLVEQALREAGRGGYELILAAREQGESANVGELPRVGDSTGRAVRLVNASHSWAMRIDIRVGALRRSWWSVYQNVGGWECVQRHVITG